MQRTQGRNKRHKVDVFQGSSGSGSSTAALVAALESQSSVRRRASGLRLHELDLGDCHVTEAGARHVARLIALNTPISTLSLSGNKSVTTDGWRHITDALKRNDVITRLQLDYNNLGDDGAKLLCEALRENHSITSVDLEGNRIGQAGAQDLLTALRRNTWIRDVTLMPGNRFDQQALSDLRHALHTNAAAVTD